MVTMLLRALCIKTFSFGFCFYFLTILSGVTFSLIKFEMESYGAIDSAFKIPLVLTRFFFTLAHRSASLK